MSLQKMYFKSSIPHLARKSAHFTTVRSMINPDRRCLAVSKGWKRFLESSPGLWQELEVNRGMSTTAVKACLRRSEKANYGLKSATLNVFSSRHFKLIQRCPKLESLINNSAENELVIKEIGQLKSLKRLALRGKAPVSNLSLMQLLARHPGLQHVEVHGLYMKFALFDSWPMMPQLRSIGLYRDMAGDKSVRPPFHFIVSYIYSVFTCRD